MRVVAGAHEVWGGEEEEGEKVWTIGFFMSNKRTKKEPKCEKDENSECMYAVLIELRKLPSRAR